MFFGFLLGISACMIWGIIYVIPLILADYSPAFIALARYLVFAVFSAVYLWVKRREIRLCPADWLEAVRLGLIGNLAFYWVLSEAVVRIGAALAGIFTACIPVVASLWVLLREKNWRHDDRRLWTALAVILAGLIFLNVDRFETLRGIDSNLFTSDDARFSSFDYAVGILFALVSVLIWTWFPLKNAEWLKRHPKVSVSVWTAAQGVTLFPFTLFLLSADAIFNDAFLVPDGRCLIWLLVLGLGCSWLGSLLWNEASRRLPSVLVGQMLVFETVSAIVYASILEGIFPSLPTLAGIIVVLSGVLYSLNLLRQRSDLLLS